MQLVHKGEHPGKTSYVYLPIIDMNPNDLTCIFSTLTFIIQHARKHKVKPVVTFDQPLYWKALEIVHHSNLENIVLLIGWFYTVMSLLSSVGHMMQGSGFARLWI